MKATLKFDSALNSHVYVLNTLRFVRGKKSWISVERYSEEFKAVAERRAQALASIGAQVVPAWRGGYAIEVPAKGNKSIFA